MIASYSFAGLKPGPHLLVMGAVHGDELCGPRAIERVRAEIRDGRLPLECGRVTFVPVANPAAYAVRRRYVEKNLNRIFARHEAPSCEEERIATALCDVVDSCDYLLDIHSFHTPGVPFVFRDYTDATTVAFAENLGFPYVLSGWPELYGTEAASGLNMGDTVQYAHSQGKTAVLVECGQHEEEAAVALAEACIANALRHLGLVGGGAQVEAPREVRFSHVWVMPEQGGKLLRGWQNLDSVVAGEPLAQLADGTLLVAPRDGAMIMPKQDAVAGEEWFYFGETVVRA